MHSLAVWKEQMWPCHLQRGGEAMFGLREFWEVILPQHQCPVLKVLKAQKRGGFITKEKKFIYPLHTLLQNNSIEHTEVIGHLYGNFFFFHF